MQQQMVKSNVIFLIGLVIVATLESKRNSI